MLKIVKVNNSLFQVWEVTPKKEIFISSHATKKEAELKIAALKQQSLHANWCEENEF